MSSDHDTGPVGKPLAFDIGDGQTDGDDMPTILIAIRDDLITIKTMTIELNAGMIAIGARLSAIEQAMAIPKNPPALRP